MILTDEIRQDDPVRVDISRIVQVEREVKCAGRVSGKIDVGQCTLAKLRLGAGVRDIGVDLFKVDVEPVGVRHASGQLAADLQR